MGSGSTPATARSTPAESSSKSSPATRAVSTAPVLSAAYLSQRTHSMERLTAAYLRVSWYDTAVLLRFTQAARKHKIGKSRAQYVIDNPFVVFRIPAPDDHSDDRILYLGDDET